MPLTDNKCKSLKPQKTPYKTADSQGLFLLVMPNGSKYWRLKYRYLDKEKLLSIGVYPEVSLAEAREATTEARKTLKAGQDPSLVKKEKKRQLVLNSENNFEAIARDWHNNYSVRWSNNYSNEVIHHLERDIFPYMGKRPIKDITPLELLEVIKRVEARGALDMAKRDLQLCGQVFKYAVPHGFVSHNIAQDVVGALKPRKVKHFASLSIDSLPEFLRVLDHNDVRLYPHTKRAVRLLMLTFVRTNELIGAKWNEIDFKNAQWDIPAERMKMRNPHVVPLSKQALELLKTQYEETGRWEFVFPNQVRPMKCMSNGTILKALERLGYKGQMTGHGFRALAMSTIKEQLGYRHEVVDRQLAHAQRNKVDAAYDRAQFLKDRKKMMQEWADYLDAIAVKSEIVKGKFAND